MFFSVVHGVVEMASGVGITALIAAALAIFIPVYGMVISIAALFLAAIAALSGDRVLSTATSLTVALNTFLLSPVLFLPGAPFSTFNPSRTANIIFALVGIFAPVLITTLKYFVEPSALTEGVLEGERAPPTQRQPAEPSVATSASAPTSRVVSLAENNATEVSEVNENGAIQPSQMSRWNALIRYDAELAAADEKIQPLGQGWIGRLAKEYFAANSKANLPRIVENIILAGIKSVQESDKSPPEKWRILALYEPLLREAEAKVAPLGEKWVSRLIEDYILINDSAYLGRIIDGVFKEERRQSGRASKIVETGEHMGYTWSRIEGGIFELNFHNRYIPFNDINELELHLASSIRATRPTNWQVKVANEGSEPRASWFVFSNGIIQAITPDSQRVYFTNQQDLQLFLKGE